MFGIDIIDASLLPALFVALFAGILSFLSPCVLPIVPPYLAYMSGISMGDLRQGRSAARWPPSSSSWACPPSSSCSGPPPPPSAWLFLGDQTLPRNRRRHHRDAVRRAFHRHLSGSAFSTATCGLMPATTAARPSAPTSSASPSPSAGRPASARSWQRSCPSPTQQDSVTRGAALLTTYAFGLGIPFLLVAAFFPRMTPVMAFMKRHMERIERLMGLLLVDHRPADADRRLLTILLLAAGTPATVDATRLSYPRQATILRHDSPQ